MVTKCSKLRQVIILRSYKVTGKFFIRYFALGEIATGEVTTDLLAARLFCYVTFRSYSNNEIIFNELSWSEVSDYGLPCHYPKSAKY